MEPTKFLFFKTNKKKSLMVREAEFPIDKKVYILLLYSKASRE
jgi:hypothetical protein